MTPDERRIQIADSFISALSQIVTTSRDFTDSSVHTLVVAALREEGRNGEERGAKRLREAAAQFAYLHENGSFDMADGIRHIDIDVTPRKEKA